MTEKEFAESVINKISSYFIVNQEMFDKSGSNRIDYLLQIPNTQYYFGIEFKQFIKMRGEKIGEYLLQAKRYSQALWLVGNEYKRIPIFICPPISYYQLIAPSKYHKPIISDGVEYFRDMHDKNHYHHAVNPILAKILNIGEVRTTIFNQHKIIYFDFCNVIIWHQLKGVHSVNYSKLINKINEFAGV